MLLPQCFELGSPPVAFLAFDERQQLAGAAAFHRLNRETIGLGIFIVRAYRRRGVGSQLLRAVRDLALARGDLAIRTTVDLRAHPEAEPFLAAHGFHVHSRLIRSEGSLAAIGPLVRRLHARLAAAGKIPSTARILHSTALPAAEVLRAYRELVVPDLRGRPELAEFIVSRPSFDASLLQVGDRWAGMLIGVRNDGHGSGLLQAVAVAPDFRGGWGWANVVLLADAMEKSQGAGATRLRFEMESDNWKVLPGIERAAGLITAEHAAFLHELAPRNS